MSNDIFIKMNNKQIIKRNIVTGHILSDYYKNEEYPVDLIEITLELSRNDSNFDKIRKLELEVIDSITSPNQSFTKTVRLPFKKDYFKCHIMNFMDVYFKYDSNITGTFNVKIKEINLSFLSC